MAIEFRKDGPWALPEGWVWAPLGDLGNWTGGGTPSKSNPSFWEGGAIPWVSPKDMKVHTIDETVDLITEEAVAKSSTKLIPRNSVLMVVRSGILNHTFPIAVSAREVTLNQDMRALTPLPGIDPQYLSRVLKRLQRLILDECSKDGTTVASVEPAKLEAVWIPIAPFAEQRRIVARIDELFAEIADGETALTRARTDLDTWRRALLKAAVTGELTREWRNLNQPNETGVQMAVRYAAAIDSSAKNVRHSEELEPIELPAIPESWVWTKLGNVIVSAEYGTSAKCDASEDGLPVLRMGNIQEGKIDLSKLKYLSGESAQSAPLLSRGDILFNRTNSEELVGKSAVVQSVDKPVSFASYLIRLRVRDGVSPDYLAAWVNSAYGKQWIRQNKSQQVGQANLSGGKLRGMPFPLPPQAEQEEIVRRFLDADDESVEHTGQINTVETAKTLLCQSILKAAFEGMLADQDPEDEPADQLIARLSTSVMVSGPSSRRRTARAAQ